MANIVMTRIDNRLVHGQVGMTWVNALNCNLVLVANDEVSTDQVQQDLMTMVLPDDVGVRFFSIDYTCEIIENASDEQHIFVVVRDLKDLLKLIDGGVPITTVNIGNLHFAEGKEKITPQIALTTEDKEILKELDKRGIMFNTKQVPTASSINIMTEI